MTIPFLQIVANGGSARKAARELFPGLLEARALLLSRDHPAFLPGACSWRHQMLWQDPERCHLRGKPILREQRQSAVEPAKPQQQWGAFRRAGGQGFTFNRLKAGCTRFSGAHFLIHLQAASQITATLTDCSLYVLHCLILQIP